MFLTEYILLDRDLIGLKVLEDDSKKQDFIQSIKLGEYDFGYINYWQGFSVDVRLNSKI